MPSVPTLTGSIFYSGDKKRTVSPTLRYRLNEDVCTGGDLRRGNTTKNARLMKLEYIISERFAFAEQLLPEEKKA